MVARGSISDIASVVLANALIFIGFALFYCGLLRFFFITPFINRTYFLWLLIAFASVLMTYYTIADNRVVPRIVIAEAAVFPIRALITIELISHASERIVLKIFGVLMGIYTLVGISRIPLTLVHGSAANFMSRDLIQTSALALNVIFVCIIGVCFLLMLSGELMDALETQSFEDTVSGALNRRGIEQKLAIELGSAKRSRIAPSIALIDMDHFKAINDTLGHPAGDDALRQVSHVISSHLRDYDYLGRYGGDEFLLVLPQASYQDALKVVERIQQAIRALPPLSPKIAITLSIGVTQAVPFEPAESILARADTALYEAKRGGRNCSRVTAPPESIEISEEVADAVNSSV
jgi:diguanylate cyclase (GGDEF)-like protein